MKYYLVPEDMSLPLLTKALCSSGYVVDEAVGHAPWIDGLCFKIVDNNVCWSSLGNVLVETNGELPEEINLDKILLDKI